MPKEYHGSHSYKTNSEKHRKGILWRLLTCSEKNCHADSEENWTMVDQKLPRGASKQHRKNHLRQVEVNSRLQTTSNNSEWRQRQKSRGASTIEGTATDSSTSSRVKDCGRGDGDGVGERRLRSQRQQKRQDRHHHGSRQQPSWTPDAGEVTPDIPKHSGSSFTTRDARRRQKRLVVAMLEDRDRDETVEPIQSSDCRGIASPETLKLRTTRDERKIKEILHQLSATIDVSDDRALTAIAAAKNLSPYLAQAAKPPRHPPQLQPLPQPPQLQPLPQPPQLQPLPQPPQLQPLPQPPQLQLQPDSSLANWLSQSGQTVQQQSYLPYQLSEQLQAQQGQQSGQLNNQQLNLQPSYYGIKQFSQQPIPEPAVRNPRRRGYRLFRRIFSAADNYYAVPFSPLNIIKLTKDDDQWEDLEIYVSSQKGTTAIKSKKVHRKQAHPSQSGDHHFNSARPSREKASGIPRLKARLAPDNSNANNQQIKSLQSTPNPMLSGSLPALQQEVVAYAMSTEQAPQQSAQLPQYLPQQLPQQQPLQLSHQLPQQLQQEQQQQLQQEQQQQQQQLSRNARARILGIPAPGFSQASRQQQLQQRRAEPLSPNRLLSQLCGQQTSSFTSTRASLLPRWDPPTANLCQAATCSTSRAGNRCGKLNNILPPSFN